jgi:hypothetical protein
MRAVFTVIHSSVTLQPFVGPWARFQFLNLSKQSVGLLGRGISPSAHRTAQTQNKRRETVMPQVRFEPTNPVFERAKTVYALYRTATVIGYSDSYSV